MFPYYTLVNKKTAKCSNSLLGLTVCLHFSGLRWNLIRQQSLHFVLDNFVFKTFFSFSRSWGGRTRFSVLGVELERSQRGRQKGKQCLDVLYSYFSRFRPPVMFPCVFFSVCFFCRSSYRKWRTSSCAGLSAGRGEVRSAPKGSFVRGKMF